MKPYRAQLGQNRMHKIISDTGIQTESFILAVPTFKRFEEEHAIFFLFFFSFFLMFKQGI
jgi:hypothetical protein